jgi:coenzyme F420-0:L-glutamate ligase/coenzyme F420-1:gamma-L-glutamate ligase
MSTTIPELMRTRQSIRILSSQPINPKILLAILKASTLAPSAHNSQPWRFIIIQDYNTKLKLADSMAKRWKKQMKKDKVSQKQIERLIKISEERFTKPPVIIIACLTTENMNKYTDNPRKKIEFIMAIQSVAAALENLLLAAHYKGLGACWYCAPLFCQNDVRKILKIPQNIDPQALITLGYPEEKPPRTPRKSLESVIHYEIWRD